MNRKPQAGACGVCGCAVVQPTWTARAAIIHEMGSARGEAALSAWLKGHHFDDSGKLLRVRCPQHGGLGFPPPRAGGRRDGADVKTK